MWGSYFYRSAPAARRPPFGPAAHSHSLSHTHSHTLTHSHSLTLTHSLTHPHKVTHSHLNLRDRRSTLEMACKFRGRRSIFCIWVCVCVAGAAFGRCLKGLDVFERAARGLNLRDRRSTLEMAPRFRGRRSIFCIWVCVCVAGAAFGRCLKGLDVVERAARGLNLRDRRGTLEMACKFRGRRSIFCISRCVWMLSRARLGG